METNEPAPILSRKELRKQKLMEYLAAKGKVKPPGVRPCLNNGCQEKKPVTSALKVILGKENKAPDERFKCNGSKNQTLTAQFSQDPPRRAFSVTNNTNVKSSTRNGQQNFTRQSSKNVPAQAKLNQNPDLTRTYTLVSSKSYLSTTSHLRKQPNAGIQTSVEAPPDAALKFGAKSNSKSSLSSNRAASYPMKMAGARLSIGPFVKTKTGLIPTVTQPRSTKSNIPHRLATASYNATTTTTVDEKKVQSKSTSSVTVSQRPAMVVSSTIKARDKVQAQNKYPLLNKLTQPNSKSQLSSGLRAASSLAKHKPVVTTKPSCQLADRSVKSRSGADGGKNGQQCKVAPQTSLAPANRHSSRGVSVVNRTAVTNLGGKTKINKVTQSKKDNSSTNNPQLQVRPKQKTPVLSQTVPQPSRTITLTGRATDMKTPKVVVRVGPQAEGKTLTAAQEERLKKLQEWREAKGISYKRPPMPVKPPVRRTVSLAQPFWATMKAEDDAHSLVCAVDISLTDCIKLLAEGCPPNQVKEVLSRLPAVSQKFAKYWICRARLMEREGNLDVLPMFEEAVRVVLEPVDELRTVIFDILKKKDEIQASEENEKEEDPIPTAENTPENLEMTPKPVRALINEERGGSSVVKYKITATPGGHPSQKREAIRFNGQEVRFFTPVRRSARIERAFLRYPTSLQDHDVCVTSYNDLISKEDDERCKEPENGESSLSPSDTLYIYRENEALKDKVFVQLVYDDNA
ncbi:cytoskeleton-associated protein 2-like [Melanotaenia boesemani]|uniref:cytoskeleton-associated protein 2-like n=1 Tax=Melanotaenia boesemani TaxID=1250792 RepID=UPI001C059668|nr:cytoskeleton-associated protein 2-like [Melanotaenia boesemani]